MGFIGIFPPLNSVIFANRSIHPHGTYKMDTKTIYDSFVKYIGEHARERDNNNRNDIMYITNLKPSSFYVGNDAYTR